MKNILLFTALFWLIPSSFKYPGSFSESNITITRDFLTVETRLQHRGQKWTAINKEPVKIGKSEFYYVLEKKLAVKLIIFRYE